MGRDAKRRVVKWNRRLEEIHPCLQGAITPLMPFRLMLERSASHQLEGRSAAEQARWVEQRMELDVAEPHEQIPVSYTHLTLPTSDLV